MSKWMEGAFENMHLRANLVFKKGCFFDVLIEFGAETHNSGSKPGTWHCMQATSNPDKSHGGTSGDSPITRSSGLCSTCSIHFHPSFNTSFHMSFGI